MRSTRESELLQEHPLPYVCLWMGNTTKVAMQHYVEVPDSVYQELNSV